MVRALDIEKKLNPNFDLDRLISTFFEVARDRGYSLADIQRRITRWFSLQPPDHVLAIEPDAELREILMVEIKDYTSMHVEGISLEECSNPRRLLGAICVALYNHAAEVQIGLTGVNKEANLAI